VVGDEQELPVGKPNVMTVKVKIGRVSGDWGTGDQEGSVVAKKEERKSDLSLTNT